MRNDESEGKYIYELYKNCLLELLNNNYITSNFYNLALSVQYHDYINDFIYYKYIPNTDSTITSPHHYNSIKYKCDVYVGCLTPLPYNKMMKEYGDYTIDLSHISKYVNDCKLTKNETCINAIDIIKVIYKNDEFEECIKYCIKQLYDQSEEEQWPTTINYISKLLSKLRFFIKDNSWEKEHEYRIIIQIPKEEKERNNIIKYYKLNVIDEDKIAIPITCNINSLKIYLKIDNINIINSNIKDWKIEKIDENVNMPQIILKKI